jgi:hypothetical protein
LLKSRGNTQCSGRITFMPWFSMPVCSNWQPVGHIWPETCNWAYKLICWFVTIYCKLIYFLYSKGIEKKKYIVILVSSVA